MQSVFAWLAIGAGVLAAGLWLKASVVKVPHPDRAVDDRGELITDPFATMDESGWWNAWAAGVTAGAVLLQAISQALPTVCACLPSVPNH